MSVIPFTITDPNPSVVTTVEKFSIDGHAVLMHGADVSGLQGHSTECNASYDLRVGDRYRDHRIDSPVQTISARGDVEILPGIAVILETEEEVYFPKNIFGHILPKVSLLQQGIANTPSKVDPGYHGRLLITAFNHGKETVKLKKGQKFCTLYLMRVEPSARPYDKQGKQLQGPERKGGWRRLKDQIEANIGAVTFVGMIATVVSMILAAAAILIAKNVI